MISNIQSTEVKTIEVMLLLAGGHQCELSLPSDAPLLQDLLEAIALRSDPSRSQPHKLFQIPIEEGGTTLYFPSTSIVAIATDPPVSVPDFSPSKAPEIAPEPQQSQAPPTPVLLQSKYVKIENFLTEAENQRILNYVVENQSQFEDSKVMTNDPSYRQSKIFYFFHEFDEMIKERVKKILPEILPQLDVRPFEIEEIEAQITAHNDGHYYKVHNDNGDVHTGNRAVSYLYYFHQEPKPYTGGELRIFDTWKLGESLYSMAESYTDIEPTNNSLLFFVSSYCHEVRPVICPSKEFRDSRFTLNGWVRYKKG